MKHTLLSLLALILPWQAAAQNPYAHLDDEAMVREWIKTISSDAFGGRKPMTFYEDATVGYLVQQLDWLGLQPAFGDSWTQPFRMAAVTCRPVGDKITVKGRRKADLKYPDDLIVWTARVSEKVEIPTTEYVFCGFGINAPEFGWNDYEGVDVRGKIVIAMVNDPGYYDASLFRGRNMTYYGRWLYKFEEARRQGAAGCLVLHETAAHVALCIVLRNIIGPSPSAQERAQRPAGLGFPIVTARRCKKLQSREAHWVLIHKLQRVARRSRHRVERKRSVESRVLPVGTWEISVQNLDILLVAILGPHGKMHVGLHAKCVVKRVNTVKDKRARHYVGL